MTAELRVVPEPPEANKGVVDLLRGLLRRARAGEVHSLGVVLLTESGGAECDYEVGEGGELALASVARQLDAVLRDAAFGPAE